MNIKDLLIQFLKEHNIDYKWIPYSAQYGSWRDDEPKGPPLGWIECYPPRAIAVWGSGEVLVGFSCVEIFLYEPNSLEFLLRLLKFCGDTRCSKCYEELEPEICNKEPFPRSVIERLINGPK